ncbi:MAG TPA: hypothetical protein VE619_09785 [Nitrososphaeraceae archaeon]|nr:hypothetical protein [Nitrososphaeraceae archaeon]
MSLLQIMKSQTTFNILGYITPSIMMIIVGYKYFIMHNISDLLLVNIATSSYKHLIENYTEIILESDKPNYAANNE